MLEISLGEKQIPLCCVIFMFFQCRQNLYVLQQVSILKLQSCVNVYSFLESQQSLLTSTSYSV
jgi:hypothetical protein